MCEIESSAFLVSYRRDIGPSCDNALQVTGRYQVGEDVTQMGVDLGQVLVRDMEAHKNLKISSGLSIS